MEAKAARPRRLPPARHLATHCGRKVTGPHARAPESPSSAGLAARTQAASCWRLPFLRSNTRPAEAIVSCFLACARQRRSRKSARHSCVPPHVPMPKALRIFLPSCNRSELLSEPASTHTSPKHVPIRGSPALSLLRPARSAARWLSASHRTRARAASIIFKNSTCFEPPLSPSSLARSPRIRSRSARIDSRTAARTDSSRRHSSHTIAQAPSCARHQCSSSHACETRRSHAKARAPQAAFSATTRRSAHQRYGLRDPPPHETSAPGKGPALKREAEAEETRGSSQVRVPDPPRKRSDMCSVLSFFIPYSDRTQLSSNSFPWKIKRNSAAGIPVLVSVAAFASPTLSLPSTSSVIVFPVSVLTRICMLL